MISIERQPWWDYANCSNTDVRTFFPGSGANKKHVGKAKLLCSACVARTACLNYALDNGEHFGIWGGLTYRERKVELRRRRMEAA